MYNVRLANPGVPGGGLVLGFIMYLFLAQKSPDRPIFGKNPLVYFSHPGLNNGTSAVHTNMY